MNALGYVLLAVAWVGHAAIWTAILCNLYGRRLPKTFLKAWRLFTGLLILAFPLIFWTIRVEVRPELDAHPVGFGGIYSLAYVCWCLCAGFVFAGLTVLRLLRAKSQTVLHERTETHDLWATLGPACRGDGKHGWVTRLPFNGVFNLDITHLTLGLQRLPATLDGLSVLVLSDLHLHGTPSRQWFDAVFDELAKLPPPDVIALVGDYVDTDTHHEWLAPLLGKLKWNEVGVAILGNHDKYHEPDRVRTELTNLGYTVVSNRWQEVTIRGERIAVVGNEAPWFPGPPDLSAVPPDLFRLCLSHTPDYFGWAAANGIDLTLSGHTHGGAIRIPVIGSIFVPCTTGRRYDAGVFENGRSVLVVGRGLSGREPIRFRCNPQAVRLVLRVDE